MASSQIFQLCDVRGKSKEFCSSRVSARTENLPDPGETCCICCVEDGYIMKCGHYICPNCLLNLAWMEIENLNYTICCGCCGKIIDIDEVIHFGIPDGKEKQFITSALSLNFCDKQDIQQCPKCSSYCERMDSNNPQVNCPYCTNILCKPYLFCWNCLGEWKNEEDNKHCGNKDCGNIIKKELQNSPMITFSGTGSKRVETPRVRACPKCFSLVEYKDMCNEMTCHHCKHIFCFICLCASENDVLICNTQSWDDKIRCVSAPIQEKLRSSLKD